MRTFLSVNLAPSIYPKIEELQHRLSAANRGIRWTPARNCHFTLKFLGEITPEVLPCLERELAPIGGEFGPFTLELAGLGQFPPKGPASVVWVGVTKGAAILTALEEEVRRGLQKAGVPFDKQRFVPHLTIGRARRNETVFFHGLKDGEEAACGQFPVQSFHLMESTLSPGGSVYTVRMRFDLGAPAESPREAASE